MGGETELELPVLDPPVASDGGAVPTTVSVVKACAVMVCASLVWVSMMMETTLVDCSD